ncbi:MAG TPA: ribonuclease domain-containing protein [Fimbriiglobus sp.]
MAETVGFGKLEREMISNDRLPPDVRIAVVEFKNRIKTGQGLVPFGNREGRLPALTVGQAYYEFQVGQAHAGDDQPRGKRRLVALLDAGRNVVKIFFTDQHYTQGIWRQLQYP